MAIAKARQWFGITQAEFYDLTPAEWSAFLESKQQEFEAEDKRLAIVCTTIINSMSSDKVSVNQFLGIEEETHVGEEAYLKALEKHIV